MFLRRSSSCVYLVFAQSTITCITEKAFLSWKNESKSQYVHLYSHVALTVTGGDYTILLGRFMGVFEDFGVKFDNQLLEAILFLLEFLVDNLQNFELETYLFKNGKLIIFPDRITALG